MTTASHVTGKVLKLSEQDWLNLRNQLVQVVTVDDGAFHLKFRCETPYEAWRARTLNVKEAGTVRWIRSVVKPGQVFFDVGANIGLYTLMAAQRVGDAGCVYAFEPHSANLQSLLHNVALNSLGKRTKVLSCALNDQDGFFDFNYFAPQPGTSMSQLHEQRDSDDRPFAPVFAEYKYATTVDRLVQSGAVRPPDHVKIDVDGNELLILRGMQQLLVGPDRPDSIQVEINPRHKVDLYKFLAECGYSLLEKHYTMSGEKQLSAGEDPESLAYNAIFQAPGAKVL